MTEFFRCAWAAGELAAILPFGRDKGDGMNGQRLWVLITGYWRKIAIAGFCLSAIGGCTSNSFDGLSSSFAAMGPAAQTAAPIEAVASIETSPEKLNLPELAYAPSVPTDLEDRDKIDFLISKYAFEYKVPEGLVHRVVNRESTYRAQAQNGMHLGLMQLNPNTARTMGYRGDNMGLLDAETNLKYGVKYLAGAYMVAQGNEARADKLYQTGYYYHAKRMGLLRATGLRP